VQHDAGTHHHDRAEERLPAALRAVVYRFLPGKRRGRGQVQRGAYPNCAELPADYGQPYVEKATPACSNDLYAPWDQRCPWAKVKTVLVAMTGGLLTGMANGISNYGVTDTGRYKGYKTYDSTFRSPCGTTHCRTQISDGKSFTNCN
jgi:hypothetical protein